MCCSGNKEIIKNDKHRFQGSRDHVSGVRGLPEGRDGASGEQTLKKMKATHWRGLRALGNPGVRAALSSEKEAGYD